MDIEHVDRKIALVTEWLRANLPWARGVEVLWRVSGRHAVSVRTGDGTTITGELPLGSFDSTDEHTIACVSALAGTPSPTPAAAPSPTPAPVPACTTCGGQFGCGPSYGGCRCTPAPVGRPDLMLKCPTCGWWNNEAVCVCGRVLTPEELDLLSGGRVSRAMADAMAVTDSAVKALAAFGEPASALLDLFRDNADVARTIAYDTGLPPERCQEIAALVERLRAARKAGA